MFKTSSKAVVAALVALVCIPAQAARPFLEQDIADVGQGVFEVIGRNGDGTSDYWCGAGDYATRSLRAGATDRIYLWRGIGPSVSKSGKKAIQFAFRAPAGSDTSPRLSLSSKAVGDNMTVSSARQYCYDRIKLDV